LPHIAYCHFATYDIIFAIDSPLLLAIAITLLAIVTLLFITITPLIISQLPILHYCHYYVIAIIISHYSLAAFSFHYAFIFIFMIFILLALLLYRFSYTLRHIAYYAIIDITFRYNITLRCHITLLRH